MAYLGEPAELIPIMREKIQKGEGFWLEVTGGSMSPTLRHLRDKVYISPLLRKAKRGDILLTAVRGNHCLLHRVVKRDGDMLYYRGDAMRVREGPLPQSDVIGIVTQAKIGDRAYKTDPVSFKLASLARRKAHALILLFRRAWRKLFPGT